jgi:hypothetical protein
VVIGAPSRVAVRHFATTARGLAVHPPYLGFRATVGLQERPHRM